MSKQLSNENWLQIRYEYENTKTSMQKLAEKYNTNAMAISRRARAEKWVKFSSKKEVIVTVESATAKAVVEHRALLNEIGIRKVKEIIDELGNNYNPIDEPLIVSYALSYQRMLILEERVQNEGEVIQSAKTGSLYLNPAFTALQSVKADVAKLGDKFGASVASRKRVGIELGKKKDKTGSLFEFLDKIKEDDIEI